MILAIIPARGGSKRLARKNITTFGGRPLMAWSIALAQRLKKVHYVVSTDDPGIAAVARAFGAPVIDRPAELADDESTMTKVVIHAVQQARTRGLTFDSVMLLQPTNPLRPLPMVESAIARFIGEPCDSLIAVSRRLLKTGAVEGGRFIPNYAAAAQSRSILPTYYENGLLYLTKIATLLERESLYGERVLAFETGRPFDEVDIDEPVDMVIGEAILATVRDQLDYA